MMHKRQWRVVIARGTERAQEDFGIVEAKEEIHDQVN
jgi:hypothetical protein